MPKYESYKVGDTEFSFNSFPVIVAKHAYTFADLDASDDLKIPVESGHIVLGVAHEVVLAFTGGTPALDIGDGTDVDFWAVNTDLDLSTIGNFYNSMGSANAGGAGAKFNSGGIVQLSHAASLAAGSGVVYIIMLDLNTNWRTSGNI